VYPRERSPFWYVAYWCPKTLRRRNRSSKQRRDDPLGYKRALDMARTLAEDGRAAKIELPAAAWAVWVPSWLEFKHSSGNRTLATEKHRWHYVEAFLAEHRIHTPAGVTYQLGLDYLTWRQTKKTRSGRGGFNNALAELRQLGRIMREAVRRGFITASPLERMGIKRHKAAEKPEITNEEIAKIRAALRDTEGHLPITERWMTVSFEIAIHQGCRLTETSLPLSDINEAAGTITFRQKGDRVFTTRLHDGLRPLLARLRAAGATRTCVLHRLASRDWSRFFKGRPERNQPSVAPRICFHCTRVTVITRLARAGVPIQQAMAYVGHADQTIHRIYQRLQAPDLAACSSALVFSGSDRPQNPGDAGASDERRQPTHSAAADR
jgi:site-specific recombinase XerD